MNILRLSDDLRSDVGNSTLDQEESWMDLLDSINHYLVTNNIDRRHLNPLQLKKILRELNYRYYYGYVPQLHRKLTEYSYQIDLAKE